jgi:DNA replication and repair protein RecF
MIIKTLRLRNFRNYGLQYMEFNELYNILYGENAQGKTNVLEAIFLCSTGRSHRTQKDAEMVRFGEESAVVTLEMERKNSGVFKIEIEIRRTGRKSIHVNGIPQRRAGDLLGRLNCAIFSPEDLAIIKEEPQLRRRFLDMFVSQIKPSYYFNLQRYLSALRQRNALLRQSRENHRILETVGAWDMQLAESGSKIMRERIYFIDQISRSAQENHSRITDGREELSVKYAPSIKIDDDIKHGAEEHIYKLFLRALEQGLQTDIARMATQCGPHKDDIACGVDGRSLRLFGSQGQQRTAALALKMAQVDVMAVETGDIPVLLLDDVMSELDGSRRDNLSVNMKSSQTFITGTERYNPGVSANPGAGCFRVENGRVSKDA